MVIQVLKSDLSFEGCPIYIRQFAHTFEYLLIYKGQLYNATIDLTPRKAKFQDIRDYSKEEIEATCKSLYVMARTTITSLKKAQKELNAEAKAKSKPKPHGKSKVR